MKITFNDLPEAVAKLSDQLEKIELLLTFNTQTIVSLDADRWFDLTELCAYLPDKPAKPTVYAWVNQRLIPYHKGGKKLRFLKSEIDVWLKSGRQQTMAEMATSSDQFLRSNKKKSGGPK
jgi:excisionase family DNA binding protein